VRPVHLNVVKHGKEGIVIKGMSLGDKKNVWWSHDPNSQMTLDGKAGSMKSL